MSTRALDNWIEDRLDVVARTGPEHRLRQCLFCGRSRSMKVNVDTLRFICFHEDCRQAGGLLKLVQVVEDVSYDEAIRIMGNLVRGVIKARPHTEVADMLADLQRGVLAPEGDPDDGDDLRIQLPPEFIPCWNGEAWRIPKYLTEQRRLRRADIQRWGLGFCKQGTYRGRVIVPIRCDGMSSFVARDFTGRKDRPKYLAPAEVGGFMLFGYDEVEPGAGPLVAVEGVFDAMRLWSYGIQAVAYFGDHLTPAHVELLDRLGGIDLVLMPDGNDPKAQAKAVRSARGLEARYRSVKLALLAPGLDPDTAGRAEVARAIAESHLPKDHEGAAVRLRSLRRSPLES